MIKLRQVEILHALLSAGSVTGAATTLHLSQPAVSKALQQLEQQLGYALFDRERGRLKPTAEALILWEEIASLMPQLEALRGLARNLHKGVGCRLRIVAIPSLAQALLPAAIALFRRGHPELAIDLRAQHTRELIRALLTRDADIGFDFGGLAHPAILRERLCATELVCVAPTGWFRRSLALNRQVLAQHPAIALAASDPVTDLQARHGLPPPEARALLSAQTFHAAAALARQGLGYAIVDPFTARSMPTQGISINPLDPQVPLWVEGVLPANRPVSSLARGLVAAVKRAAKH